MTKEELKQYIIDETGRKPEVVNKMCDYSLFNAWLVWNGIINFTDDIIEVYKAAFSKQYLTFEDLNFTTNTEIFVGHNIHTNKEIRAKVKFKNNYGLTIENYSNNKYSAVCFNNTRNIVKPKNTRFEYEKCSIIYNLTKEEVTKLMKEIQDLPKVEE